MIRNIDIIFIVIVLFIYTIQTLVTYQVTNDHGLISLHKLNTSIAQTRLVNVRTTQMWLHNSFHLYNLNPTITTTSCWMDQDTTNHILLDGPRQDYVTSDESSFPLYLSDGRIASRDITLDRT